MNFTDGVKVPINGLTDKFNDLTYLAWAKALSLSHRVSQSVATFDEKPYLSFFGGAVVAVDIKDSDEQKNSRIWLPVLNKENLPIPEEILTPRDIHDSIARCKAKSIALNTGIGMSVYGGFDENILGFLNFIDVAPTSDLSKVSVPYNENHITGSKYIEWATAFTAAKITDPMFCFEVKMFKSGEGYIPVLKVGNGYSVAVTINYQGQEHTEWLPIMDIYGDSIENPTIYEWNTSVMRALTKAIAVVSGYGLGIYAKEELNNLLGREPIQKKNHPESISDMSKLISQPEPFEEVQDTNHSTDELQNLDSDLNKVKTITLVDKEEIEEFRTILIDKGVAEVEILEFLEAGTDTLENISPALFEQAKTVIDSQY